MLLSYMKIKGWKEDWCFWAIKLVHYSTLCLVPTIFMAFQISNVSWFKNNGKVYVALGEEEPSRWLSINTRRRYQLKFLIWYTKMSL